MTTSTAIEVSTRVARIKPAPTRETFGGSLAARIRQDQLYVARVRFPNPMYQQRPLSFFQEVLGADPWEKPRQVLEAIKEPRARVAWRSGHKVSKSHTAAGIALWFYCSFDDARAIMSSTTSRQVDQILWRELRMMRARSGRCVACKLADPEGLIIPRPCPHSTLIEGEQGDLARTGLKSVGDFREVVGFTAREAEAVAGISGKHLLYILDEASGIPDEIFEAIEGNRAGGARVLLLGNPTKNSGEFFHAFHSKKHLYTCITASSEETPNVVSGQDLVPGLATREWVEEKKLEWGEDSALYKIRVQGVHATNEEGKMFSVDMIEQAELRWGATPEAGRLFIGVDCAGETTTGDETVLVPRRGIKMLGLDCHRNLNAEGVASVILRMIIDMRLPREVPVVVLDAEGEVGIKVRRLLADHLDQFPETFHLVSVYASNPATRQPSVYGTTRDELAVNLRLWIKNDGGAIIEDAKLAAELHCFESHEDVRGILKVTPKKDIRRELGRSPDRFDALALSVWESSSLRLIQQDEEIKAQRPPIKNETIYNSNQKRFDPYASTKVWRADR